ncbi:MAG: SGNH/GDSL hydrolase family protein [Cyclobacteriaceae bacterium]
MRNLKIAIALLVSVTLSAFNATTQEKKIRILLMGDSTTEGGKPVFEESIEQLLSDQDESTEVEVINVGRGGETAYSLLNSSRYDGQIKNIEQIDYIFFRYGINDWFHRMPVEEHFKADVKKVIDRLRVDFSEAQIIMMTIIPFLEESKTEIINDYISEISQEESLELFDIYPTYFSKMEELGKNSMNVRFFPLDSIPENYHSLVRPYTKFYDWKDAKWVRVQSNEFDPLFGHLEGWYKDQHPNTTGYRLIADETAKYLIQKLDSE